MKFKTKHLTKDEAEWSARAAAVVTGRLHVAYQARNGVWKWGRAGWIRMMVIQRHAKPLVWQIFSRAGIVSYGHGGGFHATIY